MSLQLDPRQRAMLEEMGVRLFWPAAPVPQEVPATVPVRPLVAAVAGAPALAQVAPVVPGPPVLASSEPPWFGTGDEQPEWLLVVDPAAEDELREGRPVVGDAGKLLDNMLAALGLSRRGRVHVVAVARDPQAAAGALRAGIERLRPTIILAMGRFAVQALLQNNEPPGRLRGRAHDYAGIPVVVTYHPAALLRNPAEKGKAWADLCLARSVLAGR